MRARRVFRGFKVFVVISGRKVIQAVKVLRETLAPRDRRALQAPPAR